MKPSQILTTFILALFICCQDNVKSKQKDVINKVVFATGGCFGECPFQAISIDNKLKVKYHGVGYSEKIGFYTGVINIDYWDKLKVKLESINFRQLDTSYEDSVDDLATEIFIYYGDDVKHIRGQSSSLPDNVMNVYDWLMNSIKNIKFESTTDSIKFETRIQNPIPQPIGNIRFIPPSVEINE